MSKKGGLQVEFEYTNQHVEALLDGISRIRLSKYMEETDGGGVQALRLYMWNTEISEAFYTPLQGLEILLRNSLNNRLTEFYGPEWCSGRMSEMRDSHFRLIAKARDSLVRDRKDPTPGRIVAELNLGFWVGMLAPAYEHPLWRQCLRHAFPHRPKGCERHEVHGALNAVRRLRNRIAHHERILHRNPERDHALILSAASWICPVTAEWITSQSRAPEVLNNAPR